jgi:hypothetical protein
MSCENVPVTKPFSLSPCCGMEYDFSGKCEPAVGILRPLAVAALGSTAGQHASGALFRNS